MARKKKKNKKKNSTSRQTASAATRRSKSPSEQLGELLNLQNHYMISPSNIDKIQDHRLCQSYSDILHILTYLHHFLNVNAGTPQSPKSLSSFTRRVNKLLEICYKIIDSELTINHQDSMKLAGYMPAFNQFATNLAELGTPLSEWDPLKDKILSTGKISITDKPGQRFQHTAEMQNIIWRPYCNIGGTTIVFAIKHDELRLGCIINTVNTKREILNELKSTISEHDNMHLNSHTFDPQDMTRLKSVDQSRLPPDIKELIALGEEDFDTVIYRRFFASECPLPKVQKKLDTVIDVSSRDLELTVPRVEYTKTPVATQAKLVKFATPHFKKIRESLSLFKEETHCEIMIQKTGADSCEVSDRGSTPPRVTTSCADPRLLAEGTSPTRTILTIHAKTAKEAINLARQLLEHDRILTGP